MSFFRGFFCLAPDSPSTPLELISNASSDEEFEPDSPPSLREPSTLSSYGVKPFYLPSDTEVRLRLPVKSNRRQAIYQPEVLPLIDCVLESAGAPHATSRDRVRRYPNTGPIDVGPKCPVSPDRFIPPREFSEPISTSFRICKSPQKMSPDEKLLRRRLPKDDPFAPTRRRRAATAPGAHLRSVQSPHHRPHIVDNSAITGPLDAQDSGYGSRQVSAGAVWGVGGASVATKSSLAVPDGAGGLLSSGTTAPMHTAQFFPRHVSPQDPEKHNSRLALALDIDLTSRLLNTCLPNPLVDSTPGPASSGYEKCFPFVWKDSAWMRTEGDQGSKTTPKAKKDKPVPTQPYRILDAPFLRADFYYSILAYSSTSGFLAVGLCHKVYLWSETLGVQHPPFRDQHHSNFVTSLSFSSENGGKSILAVGRRAGMLSLWSTFDTTTRFEISHPSPIVCVSFKPTKSRRPSKRFPSLEVNVEDLAVGDEQGNIWYYSVEWGDSGLENRYNWNGAMTLLARISAHTQKVCGLAWSPDNTYLATGGNDNSCLLFDLREIIPVQEVQCVSHSSCFSQQSKNSLCQNAFSCLTAKTTAECSLNGCNFLSHFIPSLTAYNAKPSMSLLNYTGTLFAGKEHTVSVPPNRQKHRLVHSAAVKAIAFAPWQPSLLATGGGTNDRAIHFYHTSSGSCLATINVYAQVTSLIWSKTRREIAATLGFSQPEHPFRIAVFSWPSCEQISAIPWGPGGASWGGVPGNDVVDCGRALYAISYPGYPSPRSDKESQERPSLGASRSDGDQRSGYSSRPQGLTSTQPKAKEGGMWCSRTMEEGCIIVVSSDQSIKFHEVWGGTSGETTAVGSFGGSQILEGLEGVERPCNEIIR